MPDIDLRMDRDVVVLSAPLESTVTSMGISHRDFELALLVETDTIEEAYRRALIAGASCLVTPTVTFTRARLAQRRMENRAPELVNAAFESLRALRGQALVPQHVLAEIGPCGLPLDVTSPSSIREHRNEYATLVSLFENKDFDGFLLDGFQRLGEVRPALDAIRAHYSTSAAPIFLSFDANFDGWLAAGFENLDDVAAFADEYDIDAIGLRAFDANSQNYPPAFERKPSDESRAFDSYVEENPALSHQQALLDASVTLSRNLATCTSRPMIISLPIVENGVDLDELIATAERLHETGVQFVRAVGPAATSLHTAALAGAIGGMPVVARTSLDGDRNTSLAIEDSKTPVEQPDATDHVPEENAEEEIPFQPVPDDIIARFSARVDAALRRNP